MSTRVALAVTLALVVLLGGVAPVVSMDADEAASDVDDVPKNVAQDYEVSLDNVTINTWLLRNSTVRNATIEEVVVRNVTTEDGARENVTLTDVTVGKFVLERGRLKNVTATKLIVRNKSVLDIPGGDFIDPDVENKTIDRQWTKNTTVAGVVIDRMAIDAAILCENAVLGQEAEDSAQFDPQTDDEDPAITVQNGTVGEALVMNGEVSNWSVESVEQPEVEDASLPQSCERGQDGEGDGEGEGNGESDGEGDDQGDGDGEGEGDGEGDGESDGEGNGEGEGNGDGGGEGNGEGNGDGDGGGDGEGDGGGDGEGDGGGEGDGQG
jgi:hypothetical protein